MHCDRVAAAAPLVAIIAARRRLAHPVAPGGGGNDARVGEARGLTRAARGGLSEAAQWQSWPHLPKHAKAESEP